MTGPRRHTTWWARSRATHRPVGSRSTPPWAAPWSDARRATRSPSASPPARSPSRSKRSSNRPMSIATSGRELNPETIAERTTVGVFHRQATKLRARPLLHHREESGWKALTWGDVERLVLAEAAALLRAGVKAGDHVLLISENRLEWPISDRAIQSIGGVTVPVYPTTPPEAITIIATNADAVLAISSNEKLAVLMPRCGSVRATVRMDREVAEWLGQDPSDSELEEIRGRLSRVSPDDVASVIYTSGTTGEPKGVELAHRSFVDTAHSVLAAFPMSQGDVFLSWLPLS